MMAEAHTLPQQFTSFVGRDQELTDIIRRLADPACHLLTLVGPGGIGKTRLAVQATAAATPHFPDGTYFVNLQQVQTEEYLLTAVADVLGVALTGPETPLEILSTGLAEQQILLTLDNFEQLLDLSPLLSAILAETQVTILVTSRETLNLQEEWLYPVPGMSFPTQIEPSSKLAEFSAVQLFADRARRIRPDFSLERELEPVARICQMVEGLPLAIELAAPWIRSLSCTEIAVEIERNREFLATRLRNVPERHRSIQAIFAQTWQNLAIQEQAVFQQLAVFQGGFLRDAAAVVADATLSLLSSLLDKSLLRWEADEGQNGRYQIHELLRQYAAEKLEANPEAAVATRVQHAHYYLTFLEQHLNGLLGGGQKTAMQEIAAELNNIRVAWHWAVEQKEWLAINSALETLNLYCDMQGRHREGIALLGLASEQLSISASEQTQPILGRLLARYRFMQVFAPSSPAEIEADLNKSLAIAKERDDHLEIAFTFMALGGFAYYKKNDPQLASFYFEQSLPLFREQNHKLYEARTLGWLGVVHPEMEGLLYYTQKSLTVARASGAKIDMLMSLGNLAEVALSAGDYALAETYCEDAISTADEIKLRLISTHTKTLLSLVYFLRGEGAAAMALAQESLIRAQRLNHGMAIGYATGVVGFYEGIAGNYEQCRHLCEKSKTNPANHGLGMMVACWGLATAQYGLQLYEAAWKSVQEGIHLAQTENATAAKLWLLPLTAVLLHQQGKSEQAVNALALASSHPLSPTGWMPLWTPLHELRNGWQREIATAVAAISSSTPEKTLSEIETMILTPYTEEQKETKRSGEDTAVVANQTLIDPLTNRELEVLQLIAAGLSNRQIATELVIAPGTVKYYTSNIYSKLLVNGRTQAVAQARELGLLQK